MKIKDNIFDSINKMNANELAFLYENIRLLEKKKKTMSPKKKRHYSIDQILQMTDSSKSNWSESVIDEREGR